MYFLTKNGRPCNVKASEPTYYQKGQREPTTGIPDHHEVLQVTNLEIDDRRFMLGRNVFLENFFSFFFFF